jgi:hypothetical protein
MQHANCVDNAPASFLSLNVSRADDIKVHGNSALSSWAWRGSGTYVHVA